MAVPANEAAERYELQVERAIGFAGREHAFYLEAKARALLDLVDRRLRDGAPIRALDVGCGNGGFDSMLDPLEELHGVDVSPEIVAAAAERVPRVRFEVADGTRLPFADDTYDLTFTVCTLHHVEPAHRVAFVRELARVTRAGGLVVVFEHNPLNPLTRLAVSRCAFDDDAVLVTRRDLARLLESRSLKIVDSRYILFFPRSSPRTEALEHRLAWLPLGAQHLVAGRR
jgi:SAM-dependent methyltransferase